MTPKRVAEYLEEAIGVEGPPRPLLPAIASALENEFGYTPAGAAEKADAFLAPVTSIILSRTVSFERQGLFATIILIGGSGDIVVGSSFVLHSDGLEEAEAKRRRAYSPPMLEAIKALTPDEFETFGSRLLKELGAADATVTRQSGDQGIDFYGHLSLASVQNLKAGMFHLAHDTQFYFAGQAKHYPDRSIGPAVVRELVGAISLARTKTYSDQTLDLFENTRIRPFSPLLAMLITTGEFTAGAIALADAAGVSVKSGRQMAAFLSDKGVGMEVGEHGLTFREDLFKNWLAGGAA